MLIYDSTSSENPGSIVAETDLGSRFASSHVEVCNPVMSSRRFYFSRKKKWPMQREPCSRHGRINSCMLLRSPHGMAKVPAVAC